MTNLISEFTEELAANGGSSAERCYQCGTCMLKCPSAKYTDLLRIAYLMRAAKLGLKDESIDDDDLWQCTTCYTCVEWCPRDIEVVDVITALRNIAVANGKMHDNHRKVAESLIKIGHTVESNDKIRALRKELGLPEIPPTVANNKAAKADFDKILDLTGFKKLVN